MTALLTGATATEFAGTSGIDKTNLFENTSSPQSVAEDGYKAMLTGKLKDSLLNFHLTSNHPKIGIKSL
ncbi:MAG: hypothetical protein KDJ65_21590 [Anaerolineae bacterium]|nr:hypothetical protein [Anaerolineae bacterium]